MQYIGYILTIFGLLAIFTFFGMIISLSKEKRLRGIIGHWGIYPPNIIVEYKNITVSKNGKPGILYYTFIVTLIITIILFIVHSYFSLTSPAIIIDHNTK
jgi:hypothetical protein